MPHPESPHGRMIGLLTSMTLLVIGTATLLFVLATATRGQCESTPSPAGALVSEAPDTLRVTTSWWPIGVACDWARVDGTRTTVPSGSVGQSVAIYGTIGVGLAGAVVLTVLLRNHLKAQGKRALGALALLALSSLGLAIALYTLAPAIGLAIQLLSQSPNDLCVRTHASDGISPQRVSGSLTWPFAVECRYPVARSRSLASGSWGWRTDLAIVTVASALVSAVLYLIAARLMRSRAGALKTPTLSHRE